MTINLPELGMSSIALHDLEAPISEEEVWKTIRSSLLTKVLVPMVLQANFTKCVGKL